MNVQILKAKGEPAFAVLPYEEYKALCELAEDAEDAAALLRFAKRFAKGDEETVPAELVDRLLSGENALRVWREHRELTAGELAVEVGISPAHISKLESGRGEPSVDLLKRLARALAVTLDDLVGAADANPGLQKRRPRAGGRSKRS